MFKVLELSMQGDEKLKLFLVSDYLSNAGRPAFTLHFFISLLHCYNEQLMCNTIQTVHERKGGGSEEPLIVGRMLVTTNLL